MGNITEAALNLFVNSAVNNFLKNNKELTPREQMYIDILKNRDSERGIPLANNLCETMEGSKEQAMNKACQFFKL